MFISWQTFEGLQVTVYSAIDAIKFLQAEGAEFVLPERFCQDPLEEYFGNQRKLGGAPITQTCKLLVTMTIPFVFRKI